MCKSALSSDAHFISQGQPDFLCCQQSFMVSIIVLITFFFFYYLNSVRARILQILQQSWKKKSWPLPKHKLIRLVHPLNQLLFSSFLITWLNYPFLIICITYILFRNIIYLWWKVLIKELLPSWADKMSLSVWPARLVTGQAKQGLMFESVQCF